MKFSSQLILLLIGGITAGAISICARADSDSKLREQNVNVGKDVSVRVIEAGQSNSGATLVFIPGWSTGADIWRHQIDMFAKTFRVIAFDPR